MIPFFHELKKMMIKEQPLGVDMDNLDNILNHFPVLQAQRVRRIKEVGLFVDFILVEYCQSHLMTLFPNQPDLTWDFAGWWAPNDAHGYTVFLDIVVEGKHMDNFGAFVEHWFAQTDPALVNPFVNWQTDASWNSAPIWGGVSDSSGCAVSVLISVTTEFRWRFQLPRIVA